MLSGKVERVCQNQMDMEVSSKLNTWIWWMGGSCTPVVSPFHHFASQGSLTKLCTPAFWFRVRSRKCSCQINRLLVTDSLSLTKVINPGPFTMGREHFPLPARLLLQGRISQEASQAGSPAASSGCAVGQPRQRRAKPRQSTRAPRLTKVRAAYSRRH